MARVRAASAAELQPGLAVRVDVEGVPVAVFNVAGGFYAIADTCSHEEASLSEGYIDEDIVECPKHGAMFHIPTGDNRSLPATQPVAVYRTVVEGDDVYVEA